MSTRSSEILIRPCQCCGQSVRVRAHELRMGKKKYCSRVCADAARQNHVEITPALRELLDGVLLGDGGFGGMKRTEAPAATIIVGQSIKRHGWLKQLLREFRNQDVQARIRPVTPRTADTIEGRLVRRGPTYCLDTLSYIEFANEHGRWYACGETKQPPRDLVLTPVSLRHWFCGDGANRGEGYVQFCTEGFSDSSVEFLVHRLQQDLQISSILQKKNGHFAIRVNSYNDSFCIKELIEKDLAPCCRYKLRHVHQTTFRNGHRLTPEDKTQLLEDCATNMTLRDIQARWGVSLQTVWRYRENVKNGR